MFFIDPDTGFHCEGGKADESGMISVLRKPVFLYPSLRWTRKKKLNNVAAFGSPTTGSTSGIYIHVNTLTLTDSGPRFGSRGNPGTRLATICPTMVLGPMLQPEVQGLGDGSCQVSRTAWGGS